MAIIRVQTLSAQLLILSTQLVTNNVQNCPNQYGSHGCVSQSLAIVG